MLQTPQPAQDTESLVLETLRSAITEAQSLEPLREHLPEAPQSSSLLSYSYSRNKTQQEYETPQLRERAHTLTTCAISGLPLGFIPSRKLAFRGAIPFRQLNHKDRRICVHSAIQTQDFKSKERIFAFFACIFALPKQLCEFRTDYLRPNWDEIRLAALLSNNGLQNLHAFTEQILKYEPAEIVENFPRFQLYCDFATSTTSLSEFPAMLARWIVILENLEATKNEKKRTTNPGEIPNIFGRKPRDRVRNLFEGNGNNAIEIAGYARILAAFYNRKHTPRWESFVRNPGLAATSVIKGALDAVTAINVQEDDYSDELALSAEFKKWLLFHYEKACLHEQVNRKLHRVIENADLHKLQAMDVGNVQDLLALQQNVEQRAGKPQPHEFKDTMQYLDALSKWKKAMNAKGTAWASPKGT